MTTVDDLIGYARQQLGKTYVFGAEGPNTFDCSGLVQFVYHHFGINLPRTSQEQAKVGQPVAKTGIKTGDLVFSDWGDGPNSHVGIAVAGGGILNAPHTGAVVRVDSLNQSYLNHVTAVRRIAGVDGGLPADIGQGLGDGQDPAGAAADAAGGAGGIVGPLVAPLRSLANSAATWSKVADLITKAFLPSNAVRVGCGIGGFVLVLMGLRTLIREARP